MFIILTTLVFLIFNINFGQSDQTKYQWPNPPFNSSKDLTATFGEFRNTGSSDHFHNAVDIGMPNGAPVYACINGTVHSKVNAGYDSYINVKSIINGKKKHITYYHIVPSPSLSNNQEVIKGETILGTVYNGAAHVHLIERELMSSTSGSLGNSINPVRPEGGLNPYYDSYPPTIESSSLKFFKDNSTIEFPSTQLKGKIDIRIKVVERNGASSSGSNNGTYILGYRILSDDGNTVVYEPNNNGVKYRFYYIPSNSYVHKVFVKSIATLSNPVYWLTNGYGEQQINNDFTVQNNFLDCDNIEPGEYKLEIFSEDTRNNKTSKRFPITIFQKPPELNAIIVSNDSIEFNWNNYNMTKLKGYRIYYSNVDENNWNLVADENNLTNSINSISFDDQSNFSVPTDNSFLKFYLSAVDSNGNESGKSDVYSAVINSSDKSTLIVDGFDRFGGSGSWDKSVHEFNELYSKAVNNSTNNTFNISSCSNEAVVAEFVNLNQFTNVIWFLGDESKEENTLTNSEQFKIAQYLEIGGKLFITGEDIGLDLDTDHGFSEFSDTLFYHQYLKAKFQHDGLDLLFEVNGEESSIFNGLNVKFGETYPSDAPDDIEPINGAEPILNYTYMRDETTYRKGGIAYTGAFGDSSNIGSLVYLSFPFETISNVSSRNKLMNTIYNYFGFNLVSVDKPSSELVQREYKLYQNYPNPFNPVTNISFNVPNKLKPFNNSKVTIKVFNVLGQEVRTLVHDVKSPGKHNVKFEASDLPSGIYFYSLNATNYFETKKMLLIK